MDVAIEFIPRAGDRHGLWPSVVAVTNRSHPPMRFNFQEALEFYRVNQIAMGILWMDAPNNAVYRIFPESFWASVVPDYRITERGEYELVGLWSIPNQPPDDDGGPGEGGPSVPAVPGPNVGHPSGTR